MFICELCHELGRYAGNVTSLFTTVNNIENQSRLQGKITGGGNWRETEKESYNYYKLPFISIITLPFKGPTPDYPSARTPL